MVISTICPMYTFLFASLSASNQVAFVLPLPFIKIAAKNVINYFMLDMHDMKPKFVIFNIEIFNAPFAALCMQSSTSVVATVVMMAIDFVQALLALYDMKHLLRDLEALIEKIPARKGQPRMNVVEAALKVLEKDSTVTRHPSFQLAPRQHEYLAQSHQIGSAAGGTLHKVFRFQLPYLHRRE